MLRSVWRVVRAAVRTLLVVVLCGALVPPAMGAVALGILLFSPVPVTIPKAKLALEAEPTIVYDFDGNEIAVFRGFESNIAIKRADIPVVLKNAVIAAEDRNFYSHHGVDLRGTVRALVRDLEAKSGTVQGGSTITQQLVKNVYALNDQVDAEAARREAASTTVPAGSATSTTLPADAQSGASALAPAPLPSRTLGRKLREAIIANRLDRTKSKDDILFEYLTNIYLGEGAYGVGAASQAYFRKSVRDLTLSEAATLAGIIPAPSAYEPRHNTDKAEVKRKAVLRAMLEERLITDSQYRQALAQPLWVASQGPPPGPVTLVYEPAKVETKYPYFVDYVRRYLIAKYGETRVFRGGLRVTTTIEPRLQDTAETTVAKALKGTKAPLEMALVSVEPLTGFVKALVGGRDFYAAGGQVNLALGNCPSDAELDKLLGHDAALKPTCTGLNYVDGGGSGRSPGSSIKPIVLAEAFRQGIPPTKVVDGSPFLPPGCKRNCKPIGNYEGAAYGAVDLRTATIKSVNTVYARLGDMVGIENVAKMAQRLGITSAWYDPSRHGVAYSIGGIDVSPLEMASAYSVFAGRGKRAPTTPVVVVADSRGNVLEDNRGDHTSQVLPKNVADNVNDVLQAVVEGGTGTRARISGRVAAGKTGTSQDYGNAWFVGYTPTLSTSVWMGYKDRPRPLRNIKGVARVAGGTLPAATWGDYMSEAMDGVPTSAFDEPAPIKRVVRPNPVVEKQRKDRQGIDPGRPRAPVRTPSEKAVVGLPGLVVAAPPVTAPPVPEPVQVANPVVPGDPSSGPVVDGPVVGAPIIVDAPPSPAVGTAGAVGAVGAPGAVGVAGGRTITSVVVAPPSG